MVWVLNEKCGFSLDRVGFYNLCTAVHTYTAFSIQREIERKREILRGDLNNVFKFDHPAKTVLFNDIGYNINMVTLIIIRQH